MSTTVNVFHAAKTGMDVASLASAVVVVHSFRTEVFLRKLQLVHAESLCVAPALRRGSLVAPYSLVSCAVPSCGDVQVTI